MNDQVNKLTLIYGEWLSSVNKSPAKRNGYYYQADGFFSKEKKYIETNIF